MKACDCPKFREVLTKWHLDQRATMVNVEDLENTIARLTAERDKLRRALLWYADMTERCRKLGAEGDGARQALDRDGGLLARAALKETGDE